MIKTCVLEKRSVNYGNVRFFPKCHASRELLDLMGKNSFAPWELTKVRKLGYSIVPFAWTIDELSDEPQFEELKRPWDNQPGMNG